MSCDLEDRIHISVEVQLDPRSRISKEEVHAAVSNLLKERSSLDYLDGPIDFSDEDNPLLATHVLSICVCDTDSSIHRIGAKLLCWQYVLGIHVYQLNSEGAEEDDEGEDGVPSYRNWLLPTEEFDGLWESLVYESSIKRRLLRYATTALMFAEKGVNTNLISWNRVVLLHGPPGTGKTSLCKALAQKLSIRFSQRYSRGELVEVNAHSLFSKWFSESGKLVSKLFAKLTELVEEEDALVFVLIDEVESLTSARKAAVNGSEPSDAIRAVNALLTQLDALKRFPNVLVLTTSNITEAIDLAFVDRADIKEYIGPPSHQARYDILRSSIVELHRAGIIGASGATPLLQFQEVALGAPPTPAAPLSQTDGCLDMEEEQLGAMGLSRALYNAAAACEGLSGRILRKLPFLAHANSENLPMPCSCMEFLHALHQAALREQKDREKLTSG